jgi:hypothetical protein
MAATESSVVVALKEVRRLELERQRREEETRRAQEEAARHGDGGASVQYGPGIVPFGANGWSTDGLPEGYRQHRTSEVMPVAPQHGFPAPQSYVGQAPPAWEGPGFVSAPAKKRSIAGPVLLTAVVCGAAALGGLWKLDGDHKAQLGRIEASRQRTEEARNEAVAAREKAEQELKLKVAELEGKMTAAARASQAAAVAAARASALTASGPTTAPAPLPTVPGPRAGLRRGRGARAAMAAKAAAMPAPLPKAPPVAPVAPQPKMAKKKALSDDPLGGLKL